MPLPPPPAAAVAKSRSKPGGGSKVATTAVSDATPTIVATAAVAPACGTWATRAACVFERNLGAIFATSRRLKLARAQP